MNRNEFRIFEGNNLDKTADSGQAQYWRKMLKDALFQNVDERKTFEKLEKTRIVYCRKHVRFSKREYFFGDR